MSKEKFEIARSKTRDYIDRIEVESHVYYGPTTDRYWSEKFRIIMLNMEPYGYNDGTYVADREMLIEWLNDAGGTGTRTLHYSLAILSVLLLRIEGTSNATHESLEAAYRNRELLEDTLDRTVYFNIRSTSNERKEQDFAAIAGMGTSEIGGFIWDELKALEPHVMIVGGEAGLVALNGVAGVDPPIPFHGSFDLSLGPARNILIQSISHPSRPHYDEWADAIENIAQSITKA